MANPPVFPTLPGLVYPVDRVPVWNTVIQESVSGKETLLQRWSYPRWKWTLGFELLRAGSFGGQAYTEWQTLLGFFNQAAGAGGTFWYGDPDDGTAGTVASPQSLGTGDGTTTSFNLVRSLGGFVEPVKAVNAMQHVYLNATEYQSAAIAAPPSAGLSYVAGGTLPQTTYYVVTTYVPLSGETSNSVEATLTVPANNLLVVASPPTVAGVPYWNVYVGTATSTEKLQGQNLTIGQGWTEPTSGLTTNGRAFPTTNTTGWTSNTGSSALAFYGPPLAGVTVGAVFTFYWLCRFAEDSAQFSKFMNLLWEAKKLEFISVK